MDRMRSRTQLVVAFTLLTLAMACNGGSPTGPTTDVTSISGSFTGGTAGLTPQSIGPKARPSFSSIVVRVRGTSISDTVDGNGNFLLTNVPTGTLELEFTAPGFTSVLIVSGVQPAETVVLRLTLTDSEVVLDSDNRSGGGESQLEGLVEAVPPTTAALHFRVAGVDVATDGATQFNRSGGIGSFSDLAPGVRVHVSGVSSGNSVLARTVDIQNTSPGNGQIPINGIVQSVVGTPAAFEFVIGSAVLRGDLSTDFYGGSVFADLVSGARAEVTAEQRNGFMQAIRIHVQK